MRAAQRRETELKKLVETSGVEVIHLSRWHYRIGPIHLWLTVGRWQNEETGWHGKFNRMSLSQLLRQTVSSNPGAGDH
jgi:16S rRNA U516 pseudouridylate synthase RsuA-like enzyme